MECAESYCAGCFAHFHLRGALQRHRCVPLTDSRPNTPQKRKTTYVFSLLKSFVSSRFSFSVGADVIFKELRVAQSKEDLFRKSTMPMSKQIEEEEEEGDDDDEFYDDDDQPIGGDLLNGKYDEKTSAASFQQALMQWRQGGGTNRKKNEPRKTSKKKSTHEVASDTVYDSNGRVNSISMPKIEFHSSSKLSYGEKLLLKKYRRANQMKLDIEVKLIEKSLFSNKTFDFFSRCTKIYRLIER